MAGTWANLLSSRSTVPSLFRLRLLSTSEQREPACTEIPAQRHHRRSCSQGQRGTMADGHAV